MIELKVDNLGRGENEWVAEMIDKENPLHKTVIENGVIVYTAAMSKREMEEAKIRLARAAAGKIDRLEVMMWNTDLEAQLDYFLKENPTGIKSEHELKEEEEELLWWRKAREKEAPVVLSEAEINEQIKSARPWVKYNGEGVFYKKWIWYLSVFWPPILAFIIASSFPFFMEEVEEGDGKINWAGGLGTTLIVMGLLALPLWSKFMDRNEKSDRFFYWLKLGRCGWCGKDWEKHGPDFCLPPHLRKHT